MGQECFGIKMIKRITNIKDVEKKTKLEKLIKLLIKKGIIKKDEV